MSCQILEINPVFPQPRRIQRVVESLQNGGLIAFPTDSTYGIGCNLFDKISVDKLHMIKNRDKRKPFSFLCADLSNLARYANVSTQAYKLIRRLTPGPFTFVLDATRLVPKILRTSRATVGIRVPDYPICNQILLALGNPIISTTAKDYDGFLADPRQIKDKYGEHLEIIVDGGPIVPGLTTVIDLTGSEPVIIRQGIGVLE
ncbi:threonylcarbamoyl-AMP synthase [bacterium]|nr:threonylcarbamoyl-AMP synthase [candidate division CSSED10-310 bacterium]